MENKERYNVTIWFKDWSMERQFFTNKVVAKKYFNSQLNNIIEGYIVDTKKDITLEYYPK